MKNSRFSLSISFLLVLLPIFVLAKINRVPQDYSTIQGAINFTNHTDTIIVGPGIYNETLTISGNDIYIISEKGADSTIITGYPDLNGGWIWFEKGTKSLLKGFTITKGHSALGALVFIRGGSSPTIEKCLFTDTYSLSSIIGVQSTNVDSTIPARIINCTFAENPGQGSDPKWAISVGSSAHLVVENSILWNPNFSEEIHLSVPSASVEVRYSDVYGGYEGEGNFDLNPLFVSTANGSFHLDTLTPCCNAGNPASPLDPDTSYSDVGVFYRSNCGNKAYTFIKENKHFSNINLFPNPVAGKELNIDLKNLVLKFNLFNAQGKLIAFGETNGTINVEKLPKGIYMIHLSGKNIDYSGRFIKE